MYFAMTDSFRRSLASRELCKKVCHTVLSMKRMSFKQAYLLAWATCLLFFVLHISIDALIFLRYTEFHSSYSNSFFILLYFLTPLLLLIKSSGGLFVGVNNRIARFLLRAAFVTINILIANLIVGIGSLIYVCEMGIDCF